MEVKGRRKKRKPSVYIEVEEEKDTELRNNPGRISERERLTHHMSILLGNKMRRWRKVEIRMRTVDPVTWTLKYGEYMEIWWVRKMAIKEPRDVWCGHKNARLDYLLPPSLRWKSFKWNLKSVYIKHYSYQQGPCCTTIKITFNS